MSFKNQSVFSSVYTNSVFTITEDMQLSEVTIELTSGAANLLGSLQTPGLTLSSVQLNVNQPVTINSNDGYTLTGISVDSTAGGVFEVYGIYQALEGSLPINTVAPVVSGGVLIGQTLTTTNGTWTGTMPITYTYQWQRNGSPISSATSQTYLLVYADVGTNVSCVVTASNAIGSASANSNAISVAAFDADYQAILDKGTSLGYTLPTDSVKLKQNTLLTSMKADGVWAKLDVFYVFAQDGSAEFATLNWKNPSANQSTLSSPTPPTFVTNGGFQGNGVDSYIDTNFNPATQGVQYTLNNASRYFFTHAISGSGRFDGNNLGVGTNSILRASSTFQRINSGASGNLATSFDFTATVNAKSIHRTSSTNVTLFNETTGASTTQTSVAVQSANQFVLRSGTTYAAHTCAAYAMGASMIAENTNFVTDWNTYKNSL
jgi:hypothetical protein